MGSRLWTGTLIAGLLVAGCGAPAGTTQSGVDPALAAGGSSELYQVMATGDMGDRLAVSGVTASSTRNGYFPVDYVLDDNMSSAWAPAYGDGEPSLTFELADTATVSAFAIKMSDSGATVTVDVEQNGQWVTVASGVTPQPTVLDWLALPDSTTSRVRLTFVGADADQTLVCAVQFFGGSATTPTPTPSETPTPQPSTTPTPQPSMTPTPMPTETPTPPEVTPTPVPSEAPENCGCKVTGGGWLPKLDSKVSFGFVAMTNPGRGETGNIQVVDHTSKARFHGRVTAIACDDTTVTFTGTLKGKGGGTFTAVVTDNGEPGVDDVFTFTTSTGFSISGDLGGDAPGGGNIQLHETRCD